MISPKQRTGPATAAGNKDLHKPSEISHKKIFNPDPYVRKIIENKEKGISEKKYDAYSFARELKSLKGRGQVEDFTNYLDDMLDDIDSKVVSRPLNQKEAPIRYSKKKGGTRNGYTNTADSKKKSLYKNRRAEKMSHQLGEIGLVQLADVMESVEPLLASYFSAVEGRGEDAERADTFDKMLDELEALVALFVALYNAENEYTIMATITLYLKRHFKGSMLKKITSYVTNLFKSPVTERNASASDGDFEQQMGEGFGGDVMTWVKFIKMLRTSWKDATESALFTNFSKVFGLLVVSGMCNVTSFPLVMTDWFKIEDSVTELQKDSFSMVGSAIDVALYFIENTYSAWKTGSIMPLLTGHAESGTLDIEIAQLKAYWSLFQLGTLYEQTGVSDLRFRARLEAAAKELQYLIPQTHTYNRGIIKRELAELTAYIANFDNQAANTGFRRSPFVLEYFGESGVGKSTICRQHATYMFAAHDIPSTDDYTYVVNPTQKHWDGFKANITHVIFDDFGNSKSQFLDYNPAEGWIGGANNTPFCVPQAEAHMKGKIYYNARLQTATSNDKTLTAGRLSICPHSIQNRAKYIITVVVKDEFRKVGPTGELTDGIDTGKVMTYYKNDPPLLHDVWHLTVERAVSRGLTEVSTYEPVTWYRHDDKGELIECIRMVDVDNEIVANFLAEEFTTHLEQQERLYETRASKIVPTVCSHKGCKQLAQYCKLHKNETICKTIPVERDEVEVADKVVVYKKPDDEKSVATAATQTTPPKTHFQPVKNLKPPQPKAVEAEDDAGSQFSDSESDRTLGTIAEETSNDVDPSLEEVYAMENAEYLAQQEDIANYDRQRKSRKLRPKRVKKGTKMDNQIGGTEPFVLFLGQMVMNFFTSHFESFIQNFYLVCIDFYAHLFDQWNWWIFIPTHMVTNPLIQAFASSLEIDKLQRWLRIRMIGTYIFIFAVYVSSLRWWSPTPYLMTLGYLLRVPDYMQFYFAHVFYALLWFGSTLWLSPDISTIWVQRIRRKYEKECVMANDIGEALRDIRDAQCAVLIDTSLAVAVLLPFFFGIRALVKSQSKDDKNEDDENAFATFVDGSTIPTKVKHFKSTPPPVITTESNGNDINIGSVFRHPDTFTWYTEGQHSNAPQEEYPEVNFGASYYTRQGAALIPTSQSDVIERDGQENPWARAVRRSLPVQPAAWTTTAAVLRQQIAKSLVYVEDVNKQWFCNTMYLCTNFIAVPAHYFDKKETLVCNFYNREPDIVGASHKCVISKTYSYIIPDSDLAICYVAEGGSKPNLIKHLVTGRLPDKPHHMEMHHRTKMNGIQIINLIAQNDVVHTTEDVECLKYTMSVPSKKGMCGSPVMTIAGYASIAGIHFAGRNNENLGASVYLIKGQVEEAIKHIRSLPGVLKTGDVEKFDKQIMGVNVMCADASAHPKSPMRFMAEGCELPFYGKCIGYSSFSSDVKETPIAPIIKELFGVENIYGPPAGRPEWKAYQQTLSHMSDPGRAMEADLMIRAVTDYREDLLPLIQLDRDIRPLTDVENVNGVPGKRFIDPINRKTSIGFPLSGAKENVMEYDPNDPVYQAGSYKFTPEIMKEIDRVVECYKRGERACTIAKACKKDEVLPVAKEKCRIFYGNPISLVFLLRRYFLPISRLMQISPLVSECAVGINCHGPEWEEMYEHVMGFGKDRIIGGDYSKYDQKIPAQLIVAAFDVLIYLARQAGYTQEDLDIMEAMVGDVVYSYISFNGDLVSLQSGGHISGNSLTVIINSIVGALNLRCVFFHLYPNARKFKDGVRLITYGDDSGGSVHEDYSLFNIESINKFLGDRGQTYTMPDKKSEIVPFIDESRFDFLKRKNVYHPMLEASVGALDEDSCWKMLLCAVRPPKSELNDLQAACESMKSAMDEWFNHGKEVYEMRRAQMMTVMERSGGMIYCSDAMFAPYEIRANQWLKKYDTAKHDPNLLEPKGPRGKDTHSIFDESESEATAWGVRSV